MKLHGKHLLWATLTLSLPVWANPTPAPKEHSSAPPSHEENGVAPEKAIGWLKNGNKRFTKGHLRKDGQSQSERAKLASGQKPHSIVLSCSDSRVPPELVFDQKLGEIFVVRTAGEALDSNVIGSIEYAVEHLGSQLIVVMGHESCGAVKAALSTLDNKDAGSPALNELVADLHARLKPFGRSPASINLHDESFANAKGVGKDLLERSKILRDKAKAGKLKVVSALYHLDSGFVEFE